MSTMLIVAAGCACVFYTLSELGRLIRGSADASRRGYAIDVETGERIPSFIERRRRERRASRAASR